MQNPFVQLSKYPADATDPQENRATEALAACLVFSEKVRQHFLNFLLCARPPFSLADAAAYEPSTQQQTSDGSRVDLFLEKEDEESIVVEVKVKAHEDGAQIQKYWDWLKKTRTGRLHVFHLVKNHRPEFDIKDYHGEKHYTWKELYDHFSQVKKQESETTNANLIGHFCSFLEVEGIVNTWDPSQILGFGQGYVARKAMKLLFDQVATRLRDTGTNYEAKTNLEGAGDGRPTLQVGMKSWAKIFEESKVPKRVTLYYNDHQIHPEFDEGISLEIVLWWPSTFGGEWPNTQPKIKGWVRALKKAGFDVFAYNKGWKPVEKDLSNYDFIDMPIYISGQAPQGKGFDLRRADIEKMNADQLVERVFELVVKHCQVVSQLK